MNIQSLSIVVPTAKCVNNCPFCVSKTHDNDYENCFTDKRFEQDYIERLEFAKDNGTNTIILTGTGEALQNKNFLKKFAEWNKKLHKPFYIIELQTTGVYLDDKTLDFLRDVVGVKTISLSVSDIFNNKNNLNIVGVPNKLSFDFDDVAKRIKEKGFNLRISMNVLKNTEADIGELYKKYPNEFVTFKHTQIEKFDFDKLFNRFKELDADQVTFRKMWKSNNNTDIDIWIDENTASDRFFRELNDYIKRCGRLLGRLTFGALQYEIGGEKGISTVIDDDCMAENTQNESIKYLILRENAKLYTKWDSRASLIF